MHRPPSPANTIWTFREALTRATIGGKPAIEVLFRAYDTALRNAGFLGLRPAEYLFVMVFLGFLVILGHFLRLAGGFIIAAASALHLFGVPEEEALAMALVIQAANTLSVAGVGAAALWVQGIALSDVRAASIRAPMAENP